MREIPIKRLATAAVLLPLIIFFILKSSPFQFALLIFLLALLGLDEFYRMALPGRKGEGKLAALCGALPLLTLLFDQKFLPLLALTSLVLLFCLVFLFRPREIREAAGEAALLFMGFCYVPLLLAHLVLIRTLPHGVSWLFLIMVIVMAGDSTAYYVGSTWGRTKLYPAVSPKKSVEGSLGGLAGSVIGALIARASFFPELVVVDAVVCALLLGALGQLGDLFESLIKRSCGVKDSGTIFPGHGGVLDRLDSILFAGPAAFYYAYFITGG